MPISRFVRKWSRKAASAAKLERLCRKLELSADDHLLEVGAGWGGLAIYAAGHFGCRVTTVTISREQYEAACARVQAAGEGVLPGRLAHGGLTLARRAEA